jgi:hypothetical protein
MRRNEIARQVNGNCFSTLAPRSGAVAGIATFILDPELALSLLPSFYELFIKTSEY